VSQVPVAVYSTDPLTGPGLASLLHGRVDLRVVPIRRISEARVLVVAADSITDEVSATLEWARRAADIRIVLITDELTDNSLGLALECGVMSVIGRSDATARTVARAVQKASEGPPLPPDELAARMLAELERSDQGVLRPRGISSDLSARERHLLRLLSEGYDTAQIAERLAYSERTVKNILHSLQGRLQLKNRAHAVAYAMRAGLF
jgi:DNA-binding NarL/FixJ family response regulator